jgi:glutamyl/glutaminyl-tRNA synthetase
MDRTYRGRLAPSPTGFLHSGHVATFLKAAERSQKHAGVLVYRNDDLDFTRAKPHFHQAALEDLRWIGLNWQEGPDIGGPCGPYSQSERGSLYLQSFEQLRLSGLIYPCHCTRRELASALSAPHANEEEPLYPGTCRPDKTLVFEGNPHLNWRFRIHLHETIVFKDGRLGDQLAVAGNHFGDFLIWRKDGVPSYQLACAVDDALMKITEVVRGEDLVTSTFRQILLLRALGHSVPSFYHCPLLTDGSGRRLAKRNDSAAVRTLREQGLSAADVRQHISRELPV